MCTRRKPVADATRPLNPMAGLTLIELVIFIVIVGIAISGVLLALDFSVKHSVNPQMRKQALTLAEGMLAEVSALDFSTGGYSGADRGQFNDIDDYHGYTTTSLTPTGIRDLNGTVVNGLENYNLSVSVASSQSFGPTGNTVDTAKQITVTVTDPLGHTLALSTYRVSHDP